MGLCHSKGAKKHDMNEPVEIRELVQEDNGEIHMLITGIDYACDNQSWAGPPPNGHGPLDTRYAFDMMVELAGKCGVASVTTLWNEQCTKDGMCNAIAEVTAQCGENDVFIFYYTGHGDRLPQDDAGEDEAEDNCFCTVGENGCTDNRDMRGPGSREEYWLRDDDFAETVASSVGEGVKVIVLADCCHSGSICDFGPGSPWETYQVKAVSLSGCQDTQTSAGTGHGGMFSRALSKSIEDLLHDGQDDFNVGHVYNQCVTDYLVNKTTGHTQNITINSSYCEPDQIAWPLIPEAGYLSPFQDER